jgi:hypothetical protein
MLTLLLLSLFGSAPPPLGACPDRLASHDTLLVFHGQHVRLWAVPWRDFMPMRHHGPDGGSDLMVAVGFRSAELRVKLPVAFTVHRLWVRRSDSTATWRLLPLDARQVSYDSTVISTVGRTGPTWPPGTPIDVRVEWTVEGASAPPRCTEFQQVKIGSTS